MSIRGEALVIRAARASDHAAYVRLFAELGVPDPLPSVASFATAIAPRMWIAEEGSEVVGYVTWRPYGDTAHVVQLAVDRRLRGQRIGQRLLEHVRDVARAAGCARWYLNVKRDNASAQQLYQRVGLACELEALAMKIAWARVPHTAVRHRLAEPDEDAAIAARFGMPVERVRTFRARGTFQLVTLRDAANSIAGFAAFDPSYPGAATFCAAAAGLAGDLLAAMRPHADPAFDFVHVTVEGDRPLAEAVLALGAELDFEILRLGGPL